MIRDCSQTSILLKELREINQDFIAATRKILLLKISCELKKSSTLMLANNPSTKLVT